MGATKKDRKNKMGAQTILQTLATLCSFLCASFASARIGLLWDDEASYTFVDFCPWIAWICALSAFSGNGDAKVGSAGCVALFLGIWLGLHASFAVQGNLGDAISVYSKCKNNCTLYYSAVMHLCAVVFGSVGCFIAVAALATTFSVAKTAVSAI